MCMNGRENLCLKQFVVCRSSCDYRGGYVTNVLAILMMQYCNNDLIMLHLLYKDICY